MNGLAILLAYGLSIPPGVDGSVMPDRHVINGPPCSHTPVFHSRFLAGTLLLVFLTTPEYGLDIFPSIGLR